MKVLLISHLAPPAGGIATWTSRVLKRGLENWEIVHINLNTINGRDPFKNPKRKMKDEIIRSLRVWEQEFKALKVEKDIRVVHTNIPCTIFGMFRECVTGCIAKFFKKKFIVHCHCTLPNVVKNKIGKLVFVLFSYICDGFIVLNSKSEKFVKEKTKTPVAVIPNFVMQDELVSENDCCKSKELKNIVYVGGVTEEKGCGVVIDAAKFLPQMRFHLVGIVSKEIEMKKRTENVILYGNCDKCEVKKILCKSDLFVFVSHYFGEGFSCALTEAMAAGLPCVVSDWAANADMIESKGGVVIPPNNVQVLVETIKILANDFSKRKEYSLWNVEKVKKSYIDDIVLKRYTEFYEAVMKGHFAADQNKPYV